VWHMLVTLLVLVTGLGWAGFQVPGPALTSVHNCAGQGRFSHARPCPYTGPGGVFLG